MLSDTTIKAAKPKPDKPYKLADAFGLYLLINPNGSKLWRMKYRIGVKEKSLAFGTYPTISLMKARALRDDAKKKLAIGIDPAEEKKQEKQHEVNKKQNTFNLVCERWIDVNKNWGDKYRQDVRARVNNHITPFIGDTPIDEITRNDLIEIIDRLNIKKMHSDSVGKIHGYISATFKHAIAAGIIDRNIAEDIRPLLPTGSPTKNRAALSKDKLPEFLHKLDMYQGRYETIIALRLLLWTATRPQETYAAKWCEFNFDAGLWTIPIERMKQKRSHVIPLQTQAIGALKELHRVTGRSVYLFPSQTTPDSHMSENTLNVALKKRMGFDCTAHGMRATFSTMANELGFRADVIEVSLAHVDHSVRGIYNRAEYMLERREMMQKWADYLDEIKRQRLQMNQ